MGRVWDCIMLRDELDMLECRLAELEDPVYRHVIVEAPVTHRGDPKPLWYADNQERYARWADRIIHVIADDLPDSDDPWVREHAQRDAAWQAVLDAGATDDDIVYITDVDEILSPEALAFLAEISPRRYAARASFLLRKISGRFFASTGLVAS
jgi:hypothetical protein